MYETLKAEIEKYKAKNIYRTLRFGIENGRIRTLSISTVPNKELIEWCPEEFKSYAHLMSICSDSYYGVVSVGLLADSIEYIHNQISLQGQDLYKELNGVPKCKCARIVVRKSDT